MARFVRCAQRGCLSQVFSDNGLPELCHVCGNPLPADAKPVLESEMSDLELIAAQGLQGGDPQPLPPGEGDPASPAPPPGEGGEPPPPPIGDPPPLGEAAGKFADIVTPVLLGDTGD